MKKYNFGFQVLIVILLISGSMQAQGQNKSSFGIKGGLNLANMTIEGSDDNNLKVGFHVGASVKVPLNEQFSLQPEALFSTKGVKATYDNDFLGIDLVNGETSINLNYVDIPVYLVYNLSEDFNFHLGPYVGFLLSANVDTQTEVLNAININDSEELDKDRFKNTDFGISGGLGFEFDNFEFGFNYNIGLVQVAEEGDIAETLINDARHNVIQIYAGLSF
jgi:hypothetical protein